MGGSSQAPQQEGRRDRGSGPRDREVHPYNEGDDVAGQQERGRDVPRFRFLAITCKRGTGVLYDESAAFKKWQEMKSVDI